MSHFSFLKRSYRRTSGLLIIAMAWFLAANAAQSATINFSQAVSIALRSNPKTRISAAQVGVAEASLVQARGHGLPSLSLQVSAARSNNPLAVLGYRLAQRNASFNDLGLSGYTGASSAATIPSALNDPGYTNNYDTGIILNIPVFASGADVARAHAARAELDAAHAGQRATRAQLTFEVLQRYDAVHAAQELLAAARASRTAAEQDLAVATSLFRQGAAIKSDLLTTRAHLAAARATEQAAQANVSDALDAFCITLGLSPGSNATPGAAVDISMPEGNLPGIVREALRKNSHIAALRARVAASGASLSAARATNGPRFDVVLRHDWNANTPGLRAPSNTVMGVLSWDLFTSGVQTGSVDAAHARRREAEARLSEAQDTLRLEVIRRYRAVGTAERQAQASEEAASQAKEAARLLSLRYAQGLSTLNQLLDVQARQDHARANLVAARYQAVLARAALRLALDHLDPADAVTVAPQP